MSELPKSFDPKGSEEKYYALWVSKGYFRPEVNPGGEPYSIVIPPPNVTGSLHMGHALNATLQDVLIRWARMSGRKALWVPGTDHAGIATQNVVEKALAEEGTDRHALGRDAFVQRVWQWKEEYGNKIIHQLEKIGVSADWSRQRFTLDEGLSRAVREVFVSLYEEGLIYRATRLINWCPRCKTALSDIEVEHEEREGELTYINYPLLNGRGSLTVATTRPETMLGDTAVAVNPRDERYGEYVGKLLELPLTGRKIPVIADTSVDPEFGTGALKVTPGHDFNDEAIAKRQSPPLPVITVIGDDGRMTMFAGTRYEGMDRTECRKQVLLDLKEQGYLEKEEKYSHSVGHCYRCKTTIEPLSTPQWYVKIKPLAEEAIKAVDDGRIRIVPSSWRNSYDAWMRDMQDWCITRQIWWGHRVPAWYCEDCRETIVSRDDPTECTACHSTNIRRDEDVLDTWFSSALWPFSTLGWPDKTEDLKTFYPTTVLVTGFDILFFWVARMIMLGLKFMGDAPFGDVYLHALVRDPEGVKMSKSKGNVVDPLTMIEKYGADAFRFTLAAFAAQGRDIKFSEERVQGNRHFINKLWNATRFILINIKDGGEEGTPTLSSLRQRAARIVADREHPSLATRWVLSRLSDTVREVNSAIKEYRFNDATSSIYRFTWHEFCDWYIEATKAEMSDDTRACLLLCLDTILKLLHPFMPFLTEELWLSLPIERTHESIMLAEFPTEMPADREAEAAMTLVIEAIGGIRSIRGELNISPKEELDVFIKPAEEATVTLLKANVHYVKRLARAGSVFIDTEVAKPKGSYTSVMEDFEVYVKLAGIDVQGELQRLNKDLKKVQESVMFLKKKLSNEDFLSRAPAEIVQKEKEKHTELLGRQEKIVDSIEKIRALKD